METSAMSDEREDTQQDVTGWDAARALFTAWGMALPAVPAEFAAALREVDARTFSTRALPESPYHLRYYLEEGTDAPAPYCVLAHTGHGVNSHAIQYYLVNAQLRLFLHLAWGGVYMDEDAARANIRECFELADAIVAAVPAGEGTSQPRLTLVASDFYGGDWWTGDTPASWPLPRRQPAEVLIAALAVLSGSGTR